MKLRKWKFVPCITPSHSREVMTEYIMENKGTQFRLTVKGNCYGFEYK